MAPKKQPALAECNELESSLNARVERSKIYQASFESSKGTLSLGALTQSLNQVEKLESQFEQSYVIYKALLVDSFSGDTGKKQRAEELYISFTTRIVAIMNFLSNEMDALQLERSVENPLPTTNQAMSSLAIKAPQLTIPEFDGSFEKWASFRDTFESMVHRELRFSNIQKLYYLKAAIKIEPAEANLMNNYQLIESNYDTIWNGFKDRYNDKRKLQLQHMTALHTVKKMQDRTASELRKVIDIYASHFNSLQNLNASSEELIDLFMEYLVRNRLDDKVLEDWDVHVESHQSSWREMEKFLNQRWKSLSMNSSNITKKNFNSLQHNKPYAAKQTSQHSNQSRSLMSSNSKSNPKCALCNGEHWLQKCSSYLSKSIDDRSNIVYHFKLCRNCLCPGHMVKDCKSEKTCYHCKKKHHSSIHYQNVNSSCQNDKSYNSNSEQSQNASKVQSSIQVNNQEGRAQNADGHALMCLDQSCVFMATKNKQTLMATAIVKLQDQHGQWQNVRALLDSASDTNIIRKDTAKKLGLKLKSCHQVVYGINNIASSVDYITQTSITSTNRNDFVQTESFQVFEEISHNLPVTQCNVNDFRIPADYVLADPMFYAPSQIDLLLGMDIFWQIVEGNIVKLSNGAVAAHTLFGWVITGSFMLNQHSKMSTLLTSYNFALISCENVNLADKLEKFWQFENIENSDKLLTKEEKFCEKVYIESTKRNKDGKYVVNLPFKINHKQLGTNLGTAIKRFNMLQKRFEKDHDFYAKYKDFIDKYISLDHMYEISSKEANSIGFFLPHHGVIKRSSTTTKLRVVFDASCKSESGFSLNDVLSVGPTVQNELYDILIKFMAKKYAMKADIEKMYRQILVNDEHQPFQQIVWKNIDDEKFKFYRLNTVTYGTSSAPYLATRTLNQIAIDYQSRYPEASKIIRNNFYVDDLLYSSDSTDDCMQIQQEIIAILKECGMKLRKWTANNTEILAQLPSNDIEDIAQIDIKALGIKWDTKEDSFSLSFKDITNQEITMSSVLSQIASLFDPLGLVSPVIINAKLFMKKLWEHKLDWKQTLPNELQEEWKLLQSSVELTKLIKIPRQLFITNALNIQLHGFSDASSYAYGIVIYARTVDGKGDTYSKLVTSTSRIAPKKQITLARLELCALMLLSKRMNRVRKILNIACENIKFMV